MPNRSPEPLVSVITPTLNPGDLLATCIESVGRQSYPNVEHIIVDGASTDGTVNILRASTLRWVSEPDTGQTPAINKGIEMASGEILTWLNVDDELDISSAHWAVESLQANPQAGWVYGNLEVAEPDRRYVVVPPAPVRISHLDFGNVIPQPGTFITRQALARVGPLDDSFQLAMDFDLWLRLLDAAIPSAYVPRTVARFAVWEGSKTSRSPWEEFVKEEVIALAKRLRTVPAAMGLGRAAAHAAASGRRVANERLEQTVAEMIEWGRDQGIGSTRAVWAAARTEAALIELQRSSRGLLHLMAPGPWRFPQTRRRLILAAKKGILRGRRAL